MPGNDGPQPRRYILAGGTGFLGRALTERLVARGDRVTIVTRGEPASGPGWESVAWSGDWQASLDGADAIVHLTGKRVDCRPTRRNVDELISSRVDPVLAVGRAWAAAGAPPPVWVQLSSLARYGEGGEAVIDEDTPPPADGPRQMVEVCRRWEAAYEEAASGVSRRVLLRPSIGIGGRDDPATARLLWLARAGLAGRIGSGRQWVSWVALDDFIAIILRAVDDASMQGLYHVTSPNPIRNAEMMATYRRLAGRRIGLPSPRWVTTVGAWLLGSDPALALTGRRGVPGRLLAEGYEFRTTDFEAAARAAVG